MGANGAIASCAPASKGVQSSGAAATHARLVCCKATSTWAREDKHRTNMAPVPAFWAMYLGQFSASACLSRCVKPYESPYEKMLFSFWCLKALRMDSFGPCSCDSKPIFRAVSGVLLCSASRVVLLQPARGPQWSNNHLAVGHGTGTPSKQPRNMNRMERPSSLVFSFQG